MEKDELVQHRLAHTRPPAPPQHCASTSSPVQLILPEALKLLPLYVLALIKSPALVSDGRPDERAMWLHHLLTLPCPRLMALMYPRLLPVHKLMDWEAGGRVPDSVWLSSECFESGGVFLLDNGLHAFVYIDKYSEPQVRCFFHSWTQHGKFKERLATRRMAGWLTHTCQNTWFRVLFEKGRGRIVMRQPCLAGWLNSHLT